MPKVKDRERICQNCEQLFSLDDPDARKKYCCVKCMGQFHWNKQGTKYRNSDKGKQTMFAWRLRTLFGLTIDEYNQMLENQNHSCKICGIQEPMGYGWHVDHCHETNKVRGILCQKCNQGIGLFSDKVETLQKAIQYLEDSRHSG